MSNYTQTNNNNQKLEINKKYFISVIFPNGSNMKINIKDQIIDIVARKVIYKGIDYNVECQPHLFLDIELDKDIRINQRLTIDFCEFN